MTAASAKAPIGEATMLDDGTIVLDLTATGPGGIRGHGSVTYPTTHPEYANVLKHLGGLKPGEHKAVPPWPDDTDDARRFLSDMSTMATPLSPSSIETTREPKVLWRITHDTSRVDSVPVLYGPPAYDRRAVPPPMYAPPPSPVRKPGLLLFCGFVLLLTLLFLLSRCR